MNFCDAGKLPDAKPKAQPSVEPVDDQLESAEERTALRECEAKIQAGFATFVEVGNALLKIRDGKLYRETHATFESYCKEKWGMAQQSATRLMRASEAVSNLKGEPIGSIPSAESQVRPLAHLPPEKQKEVWAKAVEIGGGKPTAKDVQQAVVEVVRAAPEHTVRHKTIIDEGWGHWLRAKIILDQISKSDKSRVEALTACRDYINDRLERNL